MSPNLIHSWFIVAFSPCLSVNIRCNSEKSRSHYPSSIYLVGQLQYTCSSCRIVSPHPYQKQLYQSRVQCLCANSFSFKSYRLHSFQSYLVCPITFNSYSIAFSIKIYFLFLLVSLEIDMMIKRTGGICERFSNFLRS